MILICKSMKINTKNETWIVKVYSQQMKNSTPKNRKTPANYCLTEV